MRKYIHALVFVAILFTAYSCRDDVPYYDIRDEYIGNYDVYDDCGAFTSDYALTIFKVGGDNEIIFGFPGLYEAGFEITGLVAGMKVVVPIQQFYIGPDLYYEFSGNGSLSDSILVVDYQVLTIQGAFIIDEVDCIATLTRTN